VSEKFGHLKREEKEGELGKHSKRERNIGKKGLRAQKKTSFRPSGGSKEQ